MARKEVLAYALVLKAAGTGTGIDITRAKVQVSYERQRLVAARNNQTKTHLQLLRALNLRLDTPLELADYHYGMGAVLYATPGREREAASHFEEALRLNPSADQAAEVREALRRLGTGPSPDPGSPPR